MEALKKIVFSDWNLSRGLRLVMGLIALYQAFELQNGFLGILAAIFIYQALANLSCCGPSSCNTVQKKQNIDNTKKIEFEEVKER
jgi:hypothetical protein